MQIPAGAQTASASQGRGTQVKLGSPVTQSSCSPQLLDTSAQGAGAQVNVGPQTAPAGQTPSSHGRDRQRPSRQRSKAGHVASLMHRGAQSPPRSHAKNPERVHSASTPQSRPNVRGAVLQRTPSPAQSSSTRHVGPTPAPLVAGSGRSHDGVSVPPPWPAAPPAGAPAFPAAADGGGESPPQAESTALARSKGATNRRISLGSSALVAQGLRRGRGALLEPRRRSFRGRIPFGRPRPTRRWTVDERGRSREARSSSWAGASSSASCPRPRPRSRAAPHRRGLRGSSDHRRRPWRRWS